MENNELMTKFNGAYLATMQRLADLESTIKELKETSDQVRKDLLAAMRDYDLVTVSNDILTISRVAGSESKSINVKELKLLDPDLYFELEDKYPKVTKRAESIRIKVK